MDFDVLLKMTIFSLIPILILFGTLSSSAEILPKGVTIKTTKAGEAVIGLDKDTTVSIVQNKKNGILLAVSNLNGILQTLQINDGGKTPVGVDYLSADKAKIVIVRDKEKFPYIFDNDGNGIPDMKIDLNKEGKLVKYKLKKIEWEEVKKAQKNPIKTK